MFRRLFILAATLGTLAFAGSAAAQVNYQFQGAPFDTFNNNFACVAGECTTFTAANRVTASVTFAAPLAPNLVMADVSTQVTTYDFSNGATTTNGPDPLASIETLEVTTDAAGVLIDYVIVFQRTPGPPYLIGAPNDPNSRMSDFVLTPVYSDSYANKTCNFRAATSAGSGAGNCSASVPDASTSLGQAFGATTFAIVPIVTVPTLSEWAMILFALALAGVAAMHIRRRRAA